MNISKRWALLGVGCALLLGPQGASAAWTMQASVVTVVEVVSSTTIFIELEIPENINTCADSTRFVLLSTHAQRKEVIAVLLMAQAAKIPVFIRSDACVGSFNALNAIRTDSSTP